MIKIETTTETAEAVVWALREHMHQRLPVREYVDKRYASMDLEFRNRKIGEVQERVDRLRLFLDRFQMLVNISQISSKRKEERDDEQKEMD